jgi:hypothetical protein
LQRLTEINQHTSNGKSDLKKILHATASAAAIDEIALDFEIAAFCTLL